MQSSGLKTLFKLSLIVFAFGVCPKTEGLTEDEEKSFFPFPLDEISTDAFTNRLNCSSSVAENATACMTAMDLAANENTHATLVEKCKTALRSTVRCIENGLEACGVDHRQLSQNMSDFEMEFNMNACKPEKLSSEDHYGITRFAYFFTLLRFVINI